MIDTGPLDMIRVRDAREHNLRCVDVDIPRDAFAVVTGVSGSGKSSLAFGTVYAEAQRRFLESLSPYARRLVDQVGAPKVGEVLGLPPAVALRQQRAGGTARSSVGTVSRLSNTLRMLYSRAGDYPDGAAPLDSDAFSPNTPAGACPHCDGLGRVHEADPRAMVPDPSLSIREGAVAAWPGAWQGKNYRDILAELGVDVDAPWRELPAERRDWILMTDDRPVVTVHPVRSADRITRPYQGTYTSARRYVLHTYATTKSAALRAKASRFIVSRPCPVCRGGRLRPEALAVGFAGRDIAEMSALPVSDLAEALAAADVPGGAAGAAARTLIGDLTERIAVLTGLGLGHLATARSTATLSAGELQRLRLSVQLRSGLFGVVYVLDEPSAGLHPADTEALLAALRRLREAGNSLLVVEHDLGVIRRADWLVDVGPGAGEHGGRVLYSGPPAGITAVPDSATARYLAAGPPRRRGAPRTAAGWLELAGVTRHNLRDVTVRFPLGVLTVVTGVSGSGKSSLIGQVLPAVLSGPAAAPGPDDADADADAAPGREDDPAAGVTASGTEAVDRVVTVDQRPIGRSPRSNLATYTGLFDAVRKLFAATDAARERGYDAGRFSFNTPGGRCENCQGEGEVHIEMLFLPPADAACPVCRGRRYEPSTLEVTLRGASIADVLDMTVDRARDFFAGTPAAARPLAVLDDVGLGYLRLGQPATTLSGGEAQRVKLAAELQRRRRGRTLYVLDEPTTGLHPADVDLLMGQLQGLVEAGASVVLAEHDMTVAAAADWIIDLGPGGGDAGGRVVAAGRPADVAAAPGSVTGRYLPL